MQLVIAEKPSVAQSIAAVPYWARTKSEATTPRAAATLCHGASDTL